MVDERKEALETHLAKKYHTLIMSFGDDSNSVAGLSKDTE